MKNAAIVTIILPDIIINVNPDGFLNLLFMYSIYFIRNSYCSTHFSSTQSII